MKPLVLLTILAAAAFAQDRGGLKARELFYSPVQQATPQPPPPADPPKIAPKAAPKAAPKQTATTATKQSPSPTQAAKPAPNIDKSGIYDPAATHAVQVAAPPLGLRYAVLKRDASGAFKEIDPDTSFKSGDRIRLQVDANTSGYLYVVMQGSSGSWRVLFPSFEVAMGNNQVRKGQSLQIPPAGQFAFDDQAGTEKIFLVLTRQPQPDLEKLVYAIVNPAAPSPADSGLGRVIVAQATFSDDTVNRLRNDVQSRDLVFEKVDSDDSPSASAAGAGARVENAAYVVNPSTAQDARLVVDVSLKHH
jgi:hypothetical protein